MVLSGQRYAPAAVPPGKTRYPLYRRLGGPVWTGAENLASTGIRSPDRLARSQSLVNENFFFLVFNFCFGAAIVIIRLGRPKKKT